MLNKLFEAALKIAIGSGVKEIQKNQLKRKVESDGELLATIPCTLRRTGQLLFQSGAVAITNQNIHFKVMGHQNNFSGSELIPISEMSYVNTTFTRIGRADAISLNYNKKTYLFVFAKGQRDLFEDAIRSATK